MQALPGEGGVYVVRVHGLHELSYWSNKTIGSQTMLSISSQEISFLSTGIRFTSLFSYTLIVGGISNLSYKSCSTRMCSTLHILLFAHKQNKLISFKTHFPKDDQIYASIQILNQLVNFFMG